MEKRRVVITGLGMVSPLGLTAAESWAAAREGRCGIGPITQFECFGAALHPGCQVKEFGTQHRHRPQRSRRCRSAGCRCRVR